MLPADGVLLAAKHWIELLDRGESIPHGWAIIKNSPSEGALSATQYATALDWLREMSLITTDGRISAGPLDSSTHSGLFAKSINTLNPVWLRDADVLISDPYQLPSDAERLAEVFGLTDEAAFLAIQGTARKVDLEARARVGAAGETAVLELIEAKWPGSATHVAALDDSAGYDIAVSLPLGEWHIEVKTTTRKGRLNIHLSRNEYVTGRFDARWLLVVVGIADNTLAALATLEAGILDARVSKNVHPKGRWEVCAIDLGREDLLNGLVLSPSSPQLMLAGPGAYAEPEFVWLPTTSCSVHH